MGGRRFQSPLADMAKLVFCSCILLRMILLCVFLQSPFCQEASATGIGASVLCISESLVLLPPLSGKHMASCRETYCSCHWQRIELPVTVGAKISLVQQLLIMMISRLFRVAEKVVE